MAYRQPYRGNPELKQYHLINDFSGGLDTTSLDEKMRDNEFREMSNIELARQGSIENRKGFGELKHFNQWLEDKSATVNTGRVSFFKILESTKPVLKWANDYKTYSTFQSKMNSEIYKLRILIARQAGSNVAFELIEVKNTGGTSQTATATVTTKRLLTSATLKNKINIKTHQYVQKIYFLSYDIYTTSTAADKGIMVYNLDDDTLTVLTPNDTYTPTPIEVETFGFNVLRNNPRADVADQGFGDFAITGTYLTDENNNYIERIPRSGNFNIVAFQTGETMEPRDVTLTLKDQNNTLIPTDSYTLNTVTDGGGFFTFPIRNLVITEKTTSINFEFKATVTDTTGAIELDSVPITGLNALSQNQYVNFTSDRRTLYKYNTGNKYLPGSYTKIENIPSIETEAIRDIFQANYQDEDILYIVEQDEYQQVNIDNAGTVTYSTLTMTLTFAYGEQLFLEEDTVYVNSVTTATRTVTVPYEYNGGTNYTIDDFDLIELVDFLEFTTPYFISSSTDGSSEQSDLDNLSQTLDIDGAYVTQIQDRLVFYKGNSIYFSEQFQYDYVPNLNYILLPLKSTDEITHINFFRGSFIIFTKESIWRLSGTIFGSDSSLVKVNDFIGCIAPDSVRSVNNTLLFLSSQGLYALTQSYYQEGLENVKKIDDKISRLIPLDTDAYSVMYRDQYWLLLPSAEYDTLKYYFNSDKVGGGHPFTTDTYTVHPDNLEVYNGIIYSFKNGDLYRFDKDFTDFLPRNSSESDIENYLYTYRFTTKNDDFGYPTHDKKVKSVYFKVRSDVDVSLGATIFVNEMAVIDPNQYTSSTNEFGEIVYTRSLTPNISLDIDASLGSFELGKNMLGQTNVLTHKFVIGKKGKNFAISIEQKTNGLFNIEDIGYLFKLGKVKETR